jgi:hypothetical protein
MANQLQDQVSRFKVSDEGLSKRDEHSPMKLKAAHSSGGR